MINYLQAAQWSDNLYIVIGLVAVGVVLGLLLLNWFFDNLLD